MDFCPRTGDQSDVRGFNPKKCEFKFSAETSEKHDKDSRSRSRVIEFRFQELRVSPCRYAVLIHESVPRGPQEWLLRLRLGRVAEYGRGGGRPSGYRKSVFDHV